jgi:hypothetical protein
MNGRKGRILTGVVVGGCGYELAAIGMGWPTLSALSARFWWVEAVIVGAFLVDVHYLQRKVKAVVEAVEEAASA